MFSDIQNHWAKECIIKLAEKFLVKGYADGKFCPDSFLTRAEFASLMVGAFPNSPEVQKAVNFKDVPKNYWAWQFIQTVSKKRFFSGYPDGAFRPEQPILRVEAISVIASALNLPIPKLPELTLKDAFDDAVMIPQYARNVIASATQRAIIVNYPHVRKLNPNQRTTRGEAAALLCRALKIYTVPDQYIAVSITGTATPRPIFDRTPEIIESYFGFPISGSSYASTAIKRFCSPHTKNINFSVNFENGKANRISFEPNWDEANVNPCEVNIDKLFEYLFGYQHPIWKDISRPLQGHEGFREFAYCAGDGIAVYWMESRLGKTDIHLSYNATCEPPYN